MKNLLFTFLMMSCSTVFAATDLEKCNDAASEMNKSMPMQIDKLTEAKGVITSRGGSQVMIAKATLMRGDCEYINFNKLDKWISKKPT